MCRPPRGRRARLRPEVRSPLRNAPEFLDQPLCRRMASESCIRHRQKADDSGSAPRVVRCKLELARSVFKSPCDDFYLAQPPPAKRVTGIHSKRRFQLAYRGVVFMIEVEHPRQRVPRAHGHRVERKGTARFLDGLRAPAARDQIAGITAARSCMAWVQLHGMRECLLGLHPVEFMQHRVAERRVRFGQIGIQLLGTDRSADGQHPCVGGRTSRDEHRPEAVVGRCETGIRLGVVLSLATAASKNSIAFIASARLNLSRKKRPINTCSWAPGSIDRDRGDSGVFLRRQRRLRLIGDRARELALNDEGIGHRPVVRLRPHVTVLCRVEELHRDLHPGR